MESRIEVTVGFVPNCPSELLTWPNLGLIASPDPLLNWMPYFVNSKNDQMPKNSCKHYIEKFFIEVYRQSRQLSWIFLSIVLLIYKLQWGYREGVPLLTFSSFMCFLFHNDCLIFKVGLMMPWSRKGGKSWNAYWCSFHPILIYYVIKQSWSFSR